MFRRNFLKLLGIMPVGLIDHKKDNSPPKEEENPNNLPVVKFGENGKIANLKALIGEMPTPSKPHQQLSPGPFESCQKTTLVWVKEDDKFDSFRIGLLFGELELHVQRYYNFEHRIITKVSFNDTINSKCVKYNEKHRYGSIFVEEEI